MAVVKASIKHNEEKYEKPYYYNVMQLLQTTVSKLAVTLDWQHVGNPSLMMDDALES